MSPALDAIVGGWQINGIWTLQAGPTLGIGVSNNSGLYSQGIRANWNGQDPVIDSDPEDKLTRWFDPTVFSQPAPFTLGNAPERIPGLRAHHLNSLDLSLDQGSAAGRGRCGCSCGSRRSISSTTCSSARRTRR